MFDVCLCRSVIKYVEEVSDYVFSFYSRFAAPVITDEFQLAERIKRNCMLLIWNMLIVTCYFLTFQTVCCSESQKPFSRLTESNWNEVAR